MNFNFDEMIKTLEEKYAKFNEQRAEKLAEIEKIKGEIAGIDAERNRIEGEFRLTVDLKKMAERETPDQAPELQPAENQIAFDVESAEDMEPAAPAKGKVKSVK